VAIPRYLSYPLSVGHKYRNLVLQEGLDIGLKTSSHKKTTFHNLLRRMAMELLRKDLDILKGIIQDCVPGMYSPFTDLVE
jgi:hypothetical protein